MYLIINCFQPTWRDTPYCFGSKLIKVFFHIYAIPKMLKYNLRTINMLNLPRFHEFIHPICTQYCENISSWLLNLQWLFTCMASALQTIYSIYAKNVHTFLKWANLDYIYVAFILWKHFYITLCMIIWFQISQGMTSQSRRCVIKHICEAAFHICYVVNVSISTHCSHWPVTQVLWPRLF